MPLTTITASDAFNTSVSIKEDIRTTGRDPVRLGTQNATETAFFGKDGLSFGDLVDVVNPLQQLPIIGSLYRETSGSGLSPFARIAGGALLGGPIGFAVAAANSAIEAATGADITTHVFNGIEGMSTGSDAHIVALRGSSAQVSSRPSLDKETPLSPKEAAAQSSQQSALLDILSNEWRDVNYQRKRSDREKFASYDKSKQLASTLYDLTVVK